MATAIITQIRGDLVSGNVVRLPVAMKRGRKVRTGPCAQIVTFPRHLVLRAKQRALFQACRTAPDAEGRAMLRLIGALQREIEALDKAEAAEPRRPTPFPPAA